MYTKFYNIIWGLLALACLTSCEKDNYDAPDALFQGNIVYDGEPIPVEFDQVHFQLWQPSYNSLIPIDVAIAPDGSFSAMLFPGTYKLSFPNGQGPYMPLQNEETQSDTILVTLKGSTMMDIEVMPYYVVSSAQFTASNNSVSVKANIKMVAQGENAKNVERVNLYINKSNFVSGAFNIKQSEMGGADITDLANVNLSVEVPSMIPSQNYVYARLGVKIEGVEDMVFSKIEKIQL